jgi:hypothetical protein
MGGCRGWATRNVKRILTFRWRWLAGVVLSSRKMEKQWFGSIEKRNIMGVVSLWFLAVAVILNGAASAQDKSKRDLAITEVPRPNSVKYTTEEATKLLPKTMSGCRAVDSKKPLVAGWKNPTHGFRVHVSAKNDIETVNFFGDKLSGMGGLKSALELSEAMQHGNPLSVLLTSETDGWQTDKKQEILRLLFRPSIQLFIVTEK